MKKSVKIFAVSLAAVMSLTPIVPIKNNVNATTGSIAISEKNFPDIVFRQFIQSRFDTNEDGSLSEKEIESATIMNVYNYRYGDAIFSTNQTLVLDLTGIEYFTNLESLDLDRSFGGTSIDLRRNKKLVEFRCSETPLKSLNIKGLTELQTLSVYRTDLTSLDLSTNINLTTLECQETYIKKLDISRNPCLSGEYSRGSYSDNWSAYRANTENDYYDWLQSCDVNSGYHLYGGYLYISKNGEHNCYYFSSSWNDGVKVTYCKPADLNSLLQSISGLKNLYYGGDGSFDLGTISNIPEVENLVLYNVGDVTVYINDNETLLNLWAAEDVSDYLSDYYIKLTWPGQPFMSCDDATGCIYIAKNANVITSSSAPAPIPATSDEPGVAGFVERLYSVALGRASDPNGKADWVNRVRSEGYTGADLARGFLYSDEFLGKSMSNSEFLDVLYATFFNRPADEGGKTNWLNLMNQGWSKKQVIDGFINSIEWANLCLTYGIASGTTAQPNITIAPSEDIINFATRLYTTCLGRDADPNGLNDWATQLANMKISGSDAAHGFFFSSEFLNAGHSDAEYVKRLYRTFMGREYDQGGFDNWMNLLASGASREEVFRGFAGSAEWAGICAEYGILK